MLPLTEEDSKWLQLPQPSTLLLEIQMLINHLLTLMQLLAMLKLVLQLPMNIAAMPIKIANGLTSHPTTLHLERLHSSPKTSAIH